MQLDDLIPFGKLDSQMDEDGFITLHKYKNFIPEFLDGENYFLVLKDNSVRYVTLKEVYMEKVFKLKFEENYFIKEMLKDGLVRIMIPSEEIDLVLKDKGIDPYIDLEVIFCDKPFGKVIGEFYNGAHIVLEIETLTKREIMIPLVDKYISSITDNEVRLRNIEDLLAL